LWTRSLRSGSNAGPHRDFVAGRVAAAGLVARALIAMGSVPLDTLAG
jgi:hypothetical protein